MMNIVQVHERQLRKHGQGRLQVIMWWNLGVKKLLKLGSTRKKKGLVFEDDQVQNLV